MVTNGNPFQCSSRSYLRVVGSSFQQMDVMFLPKFHEMLYSIAGTSPRKRTFDVPARKNNWSFVLF